MLHNFIITAHSILTNNSCSYKIAASDSREAFKIWIHSKSHEGFIIDSFIKAKED